MGDSRREYDEHTISLSKFANLDGRPVDSEIEAGLVRSVRFGSLYPRSLARSLKYFKKWNGEVGNGAVWEEEFYCGAVVVLNFQI